MQLIFERIVPYHSRSCIECSLSAFRKLKTPLAETTAQSRFSRRRFCLRVLSIKKKKKKHSWTTYVVVYFTATRDPLEVSQFRNSMRETRVPKEPRCSKISRFIDFECISFFLSFFDFPPVRKEKGNIIRLISMNLINVIVTYLYLFEFLSINLL